MNKKTKVTTCKHIFSDENFEGTIVNELNNTIIWEDSSGERHVGRKEQFGMEILDPFKNRNKKAYLKRFDLAACIKRGKPCQID